MKSVVGRLRRLEHQLGLARTSTRFVAIVSQSGKVPEDAKDTYIKILDEGGFLHTSGFGVRKQTRPAEKKMRVPADNMSRSLFKTR